MYNARPQKIESKTILIYADFFCTLETHHNVRSRLIFGLDVFDDNEPIFIAISDLLLILLLFAQQCEKIRIFNVIQLTESTSNKKKPTFKRGIGQI